MSVFSGRIFKLAFTKYKKQALLFFILGLLAVAFEALAFLTIWFGFSQIESGGKGLLFSETLAIQNLSHVAMTIIGVGIVVSLLLLSAISFYMLGNKTAHFRRYSFEASSLDLIARLNENMASPYIEKNGAKAISRALRRDCRYISKALSMVLVTPRFFLILLLALLAGIVTFPKLTSVAALILLLSLPFHMYAARQGISAMDRILSSGQSKSQNDLDTVRKVYSSNFRTGSEAETLKILADYKNSESTQSFLEAYGDRINLGPLSQFVSRMTGTFLFAVLAGIIYFDFSAGKMSISEIFLIVITFRFGFSAVMNLASTLINVVSYKPLIEETVEFLYYISPSAMDKIVVPYEFIPPIASSSNLISLIGVSDINWFFASKLCMSMGCIQNNLRLLVSDDTPPTDLLRTYEVRLNLLLSNAWQDLSDVTKALLKSAIKSHADVPLHIHSLQVIVLTFDHPDIKINLWESKAFASLPTADKEVVVASLASQKIIICYPRSPKRLAEGFRDSLYILNDGAFKAFTPPAP